MKTFWIVVGIIVVIGIVYFGGKALFSTPSPEASPSDNLSSFSSATPTSTSAPSVVATESPVISPSPAESASPSPLPSGPASINVSLINMSFQPATVTARVGDTVVFTNNDTIAHNVTFPTFSSALLQPGDTFSHTFKTKGTYNYKCTIHPTVMTGTVVIK